MPIAPEHGAFEHALGKAPNRHGCWAELVADPGTQWVYSDIGTQHLSLAFANIMGIEMGDFMQERVFAPIGIEELSWSLLGGRGFMGPHSNGDSGIYVSSRELARFGYLALHKGVWDGTATHPRLVDGRSYPSLADPELRLWLHLVGKQRGYSVVGSAHDGEPAQRCLCSQGLQREPMLYHPVAGPGGRAGGIGPGRVE